MNEAKQTTVKEHLLKLKEEIQQLHYQANDGSTDFGFFSFILPNKINEIKTVILSTCQNNKKLMNQLNHTVVLFLDNELSEIKKVAFIPSNKHVNNETRERYLLYTKKNISKAVHAFIGYCNQYDRSILEQLS